MKIFFLAHIATDKSIKISYRIIIEILKKFGHVVIYKHVFDSPNDLSKLSENFLQTRAKKLAEKMLECDCLIYEGTTSSTGAGFLLSKALNHSIPTLFLIQRKYSGLYLADPNRLLVIKHYKETDIIGLKKIINSFLIFSTKKRLSRRFNLMISDSLYSFLSKQSQVKGLSMSDLVRNFLYEQMSKKN